MHNKFTMEIVWHNCLTNPPKEFSNRHLIVTDGSNVFRMVWNKVEGYFILGLKKIDNKKIDNLKDWWWADIEQTVQGEVKFRE